MIDPGITGQLTIREPLLLLIPITFLGRLRLPESSIENWWMMIIG